MSYGDYKPTQQGAIPAYHLVKIALLEARDSAREALTMYRISNNPRYLKVFLTCVVNLYEQCYAKLKRKNTYKRDYLTELAGIEKYLWSTQLADVENETAKFLSWYLLFEDFLEEIGVTSLVVDGREVDPDKIMQDGWVGE